MDIVQGRNVDESGDVRRESAEVVVIGTGAGGGVYAAELAEAGVDVLMIEEGGYYNSSDFTTKTSQMIKKLYRNAGTTIAIGRPNVIFAEGCCVGGSTVINAGICWRTPKRILKRWNWEHNIDGISPEEVSPCFEKVEQRVHVSPQEDLTFGGDSWVMKEGAERLGYKWMRVRRNHRFCTGTNNCALGCPIDAKQSILITYVPRALAAGARLFSDCRVTRIKHNGQSANSVSCHFTDGNGKKRMALEVSAQHIVVCGGSVQTPNLLLRSKVPDKHKQLGRHLALHPNAKVIGIFDHEIMGWKGAIQGVQITEFMEEGLMFGTTFVPPSLVAMSVPLWGAEADDMMQHLNHMVTAGVLVEDTDSEGRVKAGLGGDATMSYHLGPHDYKQLRRGIAILSEIYFAAGATSVLLPYHNLKKLSSVDELRRIFDPKLKAVDMEVLTVHAMGTAR
ncbi:MAG: hypothetical protein HN348_07210, partial [Proteobacteria bacterium]|nr:hypothetical protein [Pseudomonadota bacterium]